MLARNVLDKTMIILLIGGDRFIMSINRRRRQILRCFHSACSLKLGRLAHRASSHRRNRAVKWAAAGGARLLLRAYQQWRGRRRRIFTSRRKSSKSRWRRLIKYFALDSSSSSACARQMEARYHVGYAGRRLLHYKSNIILSSFLS